MSGHDASQMQRYFARAPERLVLDGCRTWHCGGANQGTTAQLALRSFYGEMMDWRAAVVTADAMAGRRFSGSAITSWMPGRGVSMRGRSTKA